MKITLRTVAAGTFLTALGTAALTAHPALAREMGLDFWHVPELRAGITDSDRRARELEAMGQVIGRRLALRTETIEDLVAGRIKADEAARRFDELNRSEPTMLARVRRMYPGDTDQERAAWQLVAHVRVHAHPRAGEIADEVACRLAYPTASN